MVGELGSGEGAEMRAPMAIAVISGLVSSTLLTLLVVPTVYRLLAGLRLAGAFPTKEQQEPQAEVPS